MTVSSSFTNAVDPSILLTKGGLPKSRYSLKEKLKILDPSSGEDAVVARLNEFLGLFCARKQGGIVTLRGKGASSWTAFRGSIGVSQVIDHLLANLISNRDPIWYGSRGGRLCQYFCLDIDTDRFSHKILVDENPDWPTFSIGEYQRQISEIGSRFSSNESKLPFHERCKQVHSALRRMGINPLNPRSVLVQQTPGGGLHFYVFLDKLYFQYQVEDLLKDAGLRNVKGSIEIYPSERQGLRLPFGLVPGRQHQPQAWIQFIDDVRNGRIIRHTLQGCYEALARHYRSHTRRISSVKNSRPAIDQTSLQEPSSDSCGFRPPENQSEKNASLQISNQISERQIRYQSLLNGIRSKEDSMELLRIGIRIPGTRTAALKKIAEHLIWFRRYSGVDAATLMIKWAMRPGHASVDIESDLKNGTVIVENQIMAMCRWYESHRSPSKSILPNSVEQFSFRELDSLKTSLRKLSESERFNQAIFLVHFLRFAKRYGKRVENGIGWDSSPAIRQVVRRWPGCHHMNYKDRINHAISSGCISIIRESLYRLNGKGRARTYRLFVPVVDLSECELTDNQAVSYLTEAIVYNSEKPLTENALPKEISHAVESGKQQSESNSEFAISAIQVALSSSNSRGAVDASPYQCDIKPHESSRLCRLTPE